VRKIPGEAGNIQSQKGFVSVMRPLTVMLIFIAVLGAIAVGWVYESRSKDILVRPELEIPTDIDFFLSSMNYRVFNKSGDLDYQLQSPYLEHFIKDDISRIEAPMIHVYRDTGDWQIKASRGNILHRQEWLQLDNNVVMQRLGADPLQVLSQSMLFKPGQDLIASEDTVTIESDSAKISGDNAVFDLRNEVYSLKNTRAIYFHADS
jgi:LPS export ABC transporter protein LptC